jgi:hypothetical protein
MERFGMLNSLCGNDASAAKWIKPQLTRLVEEAPPASAGCTKSNTTATEWMRIDGGKAALLTRSGLDWSHRYHLTIEALGSLKLKSAYLDGEVCALNSQGVPVFGRLQAVMDEGQPTSSSSSPSISCF